MRIATTGLTTGALVVFALAQVIRSASAFIDLLAGSLAAECKNAQVIAVLRIEKVHREKKAITYRKVRNLKGGLPTFTGETFTHVLGTLPNPERHPQDVETKDLQNEAILSWAEEGKMAVLFLGPGGATAICVGHAWYTTRGLPPAEGPWVQRGSADSRLQRLFCGETDELIGAVTELLSDKPGEKSVVPRMVGTPEMVTDRCGPIVRTWRIPFPTYTPWSTHRGNAQRTGSDGGPGPQRPTIRWVCRLPDQFIAPLLPGKKAIFASSIGAFNTPGLRALSLEASPDKRIIWTKGVPLLRQPLACAPVLLTEPVEMLILGDGFHSDESSALRCIRAADGFPVWHLPVPGKLVHFEGTPTIAEGRLYVGGGNAGLVCLDPNHVTFEGTELDLQKVQAALDQRWKELLVKYEGEKKKDPQFAVPPSEGSLPRATPQRIWQAGADRWHVDAPVAVIADRVLAASAYLDEEKTGERALVCLRSDDGSVLWKTPLKFNPWAGPTVGPYVLVGCSSVRLDPKAVDGASGEVVAVELDTGKVKWRKEVPGGVLSSVVVKAGTALFTATDGTVRAWDTFSGAEKWSYDAKAPFFAGVSVSKDTVYAADLRGVIHALNLADGKKLWGLDLASDLAIKSLGRVYGSPVVHRGCLYLATSSVGETGEAPANVIVCIGDK
jgi:outer membrane protein assembly factor BamB